MVRKLLCGFVVLAALLLSHPARAVYGVVVDRTVSVPESATEVDTNVDVNDGDTVLIDAWDVIVPGPGFGSNGPTGMPGVVSTAGNPLPGAAPFCLIGRLDGGYFYVGSHFERAQQVGPRRRLFLRTNDSVPGNGWGAFTAHIVVLHTPPRGQGTSALFQDTNPIGTAGNLQLVETVPTHYWSSDNDGTLQGAQRNSDDVTSPWAAGRTVVILPPLTGRWRQWDEVYRHGAWFEGTAGYFYGTAVRGNQVVFFVYDPWGSTRTFDIPGATDCAGAPALIQSRFGRIGDLQLVYPSAIGGLRRFSASLDDGSPTTASPALVWKPVSGTIAAGQFSAVRMVHSDRGILEMVALQPLSTGWQLVHIQQVGDGWRTAAIPGSSAVGGIPGLIQSSFLASDGVHHCLETVAPAAAGGLLHWYFDGTRWNAGPGSPGGSRMTNVHLVQLRPAGRFEVVAETNDWRYTYGPGSMSSYSSNDGWNWTGATALPTNLF